MLINGIPMKQPQTKKSKDHSMLTDAERRLIEFGMDVVTMFIDKIDVRLEEIGKEEITREELHRVGRAMREAMRERLAAN